MKRMADTALSTPECLEIEKSKNNKFRKEFIIAPIVVFIVGYLFTLLWNLSSSISAIKQSNDDLKDNQNKIENRIDKLDGKLDNITNILIQKK
jgi:cell division protein FtsB